MPITPASVDKWVITSLKPAILELACDIRGRIDSVEVCFDLKGLKAGTAAFQAETGRIRINAHLFELPENHHEELLDTLLHEAAHIVIMSRYRRAQPHGTKWKAIATKLGATPRACHQMSLPRQRRCREFEYHVDGETLWLGPRHHAGLQSGRQQLRRRKDNMPIAADQFTGNWRWRE